MSFYQQRLARSQSDRAVARYHRRYRNGLYDAAIKGKSSRYANALLDEAMALCGHPGYRLSHRHWGEEAKEFLWHFAQND